MLVSFVTAEPSLAITYSSWLPLRLLEKTSISNGEFRTLDLSGGQRKRLALIVSLLEKRPILLLDDCLSAVDTQTEERILGHLRQVFVGRTVILVSHRVSTVRQADRIVVLDQGRIVESGTHDALVAAGGVYADLDARQRL